MIKLLERENDGSRAVTLVPRPRSFLTLPSAKPRPLLLRKRGRAGAQPLSRVGFGVVGIEFYSPREKYEQPPNVGLEPTTLRLRVSCSTD